MSNVANQNQILKVVKKTVIESVQGVLRDPDYGLDIKDAYKTKLARISERKPVQGVSLKKIKDKHTE